MVGMDERIEGDVGSAEGPAGRPSKVDLFAWLLGLAVVVTLALNRPTSAPPPSIEVALPDGRPGAVTVADTQSGLRIELRAPDLERLPDGQFYQAWLRSADGKRLVAVGTFHSGDEVILWAGVKVEDFPTLTVTIEPDDGDAASSGNRVLVVPLLPPSS